MTRPPHLTLVGPEAVPSEVHDVPAVTRRRTPDRIPVLADVLSHEALCVINDCVGDIASLLGHGDPPGYAVTPAGPGRAQLTLDVTFAVAPLNAFARSVEDAANAAKQTAQEAIAEAADDGMPLGGRTDR